MQHDGTFSLDGRRFLVQNGIIMFENRKNVRYPTLARAVISEIDDGEALLKDLSITGCRVEYTMFVDVKPNAPFTALILPDSAARIEPFELFVESRWVHADGYACEIGFVITASPKGRAFQRYVDYLAWRSTAT
jgi:hypothetical protein